MSLRCSLGLHKWKHIYSSSVGSDNGFRFRYRLFSCERCGKLRACLPSTQRFNHRWFDHFSPVYDNMGQIEAWIAAQRHECYQVYKEKTL